MIGYVLKRNFSKAPERSAESCEIQLPVYRKNCVILRILFYFECESILFLAKLWTENFRYLLFDILISYHTSYIVQSQIVIGFRDQCFFNSCRNI